MAADARTWILIVGSAITLFATGLIALVQDDIKRVLAYSTVSQLGYMIVGLGAGAYAAGLFHLWTHAFFKALLFLGAGSVIHAVHSNNMSDMGGPQEAHAGHLSDDADRVRWPCRASPRWPGSSPRTRSWRPSTRRYAERHLLARGGAAALITAFYTFRMIFLTFHGTYLGHGHPHESPQVDDHPAGDPGRAQSVAAGWVEHPRCLHRFHRLGGAESGVPSEESHAGRSTVRPLIPGLVASAARDLPRLLRLLPATAEPRRRADRFQIPVSIPFLRASTYIDDLYWTGSSQPIKGPIARAVNWINTMSSTVVNGVAAADLAVAGVRLRRHRPERHRPRLSWPLGCYRRGRARRRAAFRPDGFSSTPAGFVVGALALGARVARGFLFDRRGLIPMDWLNGWGLTARGVPPAGWGPC